MWTMFRCACVWFVLNAAVISAVSPQHTFEELRGTWRGTSTCTDRVAAPACQDETVVYEFKNGDKPGTVTMSADKIVNGERVPMGDLTFAYDATLACWRSDFESPRMKSRWCFTVEGNTMKGTATLLPGNQVVRRVTVKRVP
jgi:hypothetical protein